jgi:hypothetical protein
MKKIITTLALLVTSSCATTKSATADKQTEKVMSEPQDESQAGFFQSIGRCAGERMPEGVLALGMAAVIPNPLAPVAAAGYYTAVLYDCKGKTKEVSVTREDLQKVKVESEAKITRLKEELTKTTTKRIEALSERVDSIKAGEAENMRKLRQSAADVSAEAEAQIKKSADDAVRAVYRQMDEIRKVKIYTIEENN